MTYRDAMETIVRAIPPGHQLGGAPEHLPRRLAALVRDDEIKYVEAVTGRVVLLTATRVIVAENDATTGEVTARTWARQKMREVGMLGANTDWEDGDNNQLPPRCQVRLTFDNDETLEIPLDPDSGRPRRGEVWKLLPELLNDVSRQPRSF